MTGKAPQIVVETAHGDEEGVAEAGEAEAKVLQAGAKAITRL